MGKPFPSDFRKPFKVVKRLKVTCIVFHYSTLYSLSLYVFLQIRYLIFNCTHLCRTSTQLHENHLSLQALIRWRFLAQQTLTALCGLKNKVRLSKDVKSSMTLERITLLPSCVKRVWR